MTTSSRPRPRLRIAATLGIAALAVAACSNRDHPAATSTDQSQPSTPTTAVASASSMSPGDSALAAYRSMWRAFVEASDVADPDAPALAMYADGDALTLLHNGVQDLKSKGLINTGDVQLLNPQVTAVSTSVKPVEVQISDCVDTSRTRLVKRDGSAYTDTPGGRRAAQITVDELPGGWKVVGLALHEVGSC